MSSSPTFEALVSPHLQDLLRYCRYLTRSGWDAEDVYQDALLKTYAYFRKHEQCPITKMFLLRAAKHCWIDRCRRKPKREWIDWRPEAAFDADYVEIRSLIEWMAERAPAKQVEIWLLADYFGYSMQEIAERQRTSVSAIKSALFRTRQGIRSPRIDFPPQPSVAASDEYAVDRWVLAVLRDEPKRISM